VLGLGVVLGNIYPYFEAEVVVKHSIFFSSLPTLVHGVDIDPNNLLLLEYVCEPNIAFDLLGNIFVAEVGTEEHKEKLVGRVEVEVVDPVVPVEDIPNAG
jgi:hypothetical protein